MKSLPKTKEYSSSPSVYRGSTPEGGGSCGTTASTNSSVSSAATSSINRGGAGIPSPTPVKQPATCRRQMQLATCNSPKANESCNSPKATLNHKSKINRFFNLKSSIINLKLIFFLTSCTLDPELAVCPYNVWVDYTCSDGQSITSGEFPAAGIRQFVYDSTGLLVGEFPGDSCRAGVGTFRLPPGKYNLITWTNTLPDGCTFRNVTPDTSHLPESHLHPRPRDNASRHGGDDIPHHLCVGRLYHGNTSFTVPRHGVTRLRVGLMHAHARLNLTVEWADGVLPAIARGDGAPVMCVEGIPLGYRFTGGSPWGDYTLPCHDDEAGKGTYTVQAGIAGGKVKANFTTLRLTDECRPTVHLTRDGTPLITPVDLSTYFRTMGIRLTDNIRQEFDLTIQIGKDQTLIFQTNTSGWEEGGNIGAN